MADQDQLDPAIRSALDAVMDEHRSEDLELVGRLRNLIVNCLADNYDQSDVRAVIELAIIPDVVPSEPEIEL